MRNFVAISTEVINARHCYIGTSAGRFLYNPSQDISSREAIDFLYSLHSLARTKEHKGCVFVWYAAHLDVEVLLKDLPPEAKDIAFPGPEDSRRKQAIRREIDRNALSIRNHVVLHKRIAKYQGRDILSDFNLPFTTKRQALRHVDREILTLERETRRLRKELHALEFIYWNGYRLRVRAGKSLTIYKLNSKGIAKKGLTIFDIVHFFKSTSNDRCSLPEVSRAYLGYSPPELNTEPGARLPLWETAASGEALRKTADYIKIETEIIVALAGKLNDYLTAAGIKITRWYGASSAVNTLMRQWGVKKEYRRLTEENTPRMLWDALCSSFYGSRIETLKLGMLRDVYVYDLNSAFAYAASLLPQLNEPWKFRREHANDIFALWYIEYDLPDNTYLGLLPHRLTGGSIAYRKAGRGWYYSPEVSEFMRRFPGNVKVKYGYTVPYIASTFGERIAELYRHRQSLIQREGKGKGEKMLT